MENEPLHRPMRQASRQVRNVDQLHAIVEACHTVRIGAFDEEGMFIVPMSFGYDWADPEAPATPSPPHGWPCGFTPPPKGARLICSIANSASPSKWTSKTA